MKLRLTKKEPKAKFVFQYNFSKCIVNTFKVPGLHPDDLPIIKIIISYNGKIEEYCIDTKESLDDKMEQPLFDVFTSFPLNSDLTRSIQLNSNNWITFELEKGDWIEVDYIIKGGGKRTE